MRHNGHEISVETRMCSPRSPLLPRVSAVIFCLCSHAWDLMPDVY